MLFLLFVSITGSIYIKYRKPGKHNLLPMFSSLIIGAGVFLIIGLCMFVSSISQWTVAGTYYVKKSNPNIKIVSRYMDEGALGGGTEPDDYHTVLSRPITPLFTLETSVDTTAIDKSEWLRAKNFNKLYEP
jgi:hypothetical protein